MVARLGQLLYKGARGDFKVLVNSEIHRVGIMRRTRDYDPTINSSQQMPDFLYYPSTRRRMVKTATLVIDND